ncbi:MAG: TIGR03067 domain-containing protein [Steroidobacteraceae bacterium]
MKDRSTDAVERGLEGRWLPVAAYVADREVPVEELRVACLNLCAGRYEIRDRSGAVVDSGGYRIDAAVSPLVMDMIGVEGPHAGRKLEAIITLDGDTLTVCYDLDGLARPDSMEPDDDQLLLRISYERDLRRPS